MPPNALLETTEADWDAIMAINLRGVFMCCKRAIAEMIEQEPLREVRGRVINISSSTGRRAHPVMSPTRPARAG